MKLSEYKSYDDLLRLLSPQSPRAALRGPHLIFQVLKIGNRLVVPKEKFIQWVEQHTQGGVGR